jgi:NAD(P)-dependent dehydrogenase (short-subunit alcohol dehydrogenase family)
MIDVCVMTGAGSGIGRATALRLATMGVRLLLVGRRESNERTIATMGSSGAGDGAGAELFEMDLERYAEAFPRLAERVGAMDARRLGLVLAAGRVDDLSRKAPVERLRDFERVHLTNVVGNLAVMEACLPSMLSAKFGRAVLFAGGGAANAFSLFPAYSLSKVATVRAVENLAEAHPPTSGLSFVCLSPGAVDTPMLATVVAAGAKIRTRTSVDESVGFIEAYMASDSNSLSGKYVHVRDDWKPYLSGGAVPEAGRFLLRRTE